MIKRSINCLLIFLLLTLAFQVQAQEKTDKNLNAIFKGRVEVYFSFTVIDKSELKDLSKIISIDNVKGKEVFAYANLKEFKKFMIKGIPFTILPVPSMILKESELNMGGGRSTDLANRTLWNFYPTYQQYLDYMSGFASLHPDICRLDTIGTSVQGRLLLAVKISDSVQYNRGKPQFFYTSSMHGDETTGYVLMLHLIDYLLSNYGADSRITNMVNNTQIFINPLANPDGTYYGGNNTVWNATRSNANGIDLNRNYPDPAAGPHPDSNVYQPETMAFMNFADSNHLIMSMNFHGGSQVFNYPWDTWAKLHADNSWFDFLGREYADTVHKYGPSGYFTDLDNGVTNGYAWYSITGGRQDYMTYFQHGREVTLEISSIKTPPASLLVNYWNYNYHSFLNYIEQVSYGINGQVTDSLTGQPLNVQVNIFNHDFDNSLIYSNLPTGWYFRPIDEGSYNLTFSTTGYKTKTIKNVNVTRWGTTRLNVQLMPNINQVVGEVSKVSWNFFPNPTTGLLKIHFYQQNKTIFNLIVTNIVGQTLYSAKINSYNREIILDLAFLPKGSYFILLDDGEKRYQRMIILD